MRIEKITNANRENFYNQIMHVKPISIIQRVANLGFGFLKSPLIQVLACTTCCALGINRIRSQEFYSGIVMTMLGLFEGVRVLSKQRSEVYHEMSLFLCNLAYYYRPQSLHWWDTITDEITLGAIPFYTDDFKYIIENKMVVFSIVEKLELKGIGMLGDPITEMDWINAGVTQKIISVMDTDAPTLEQIKEGIEFMEEQIIHLKKKIYVHCKGGRGRSTVYVMCYLIKNENMTFEEAYAFIKKKRFVVHLNDKQKKSIYSYQNYLNSK